MMEMLAKAIMVIILRSINLHSVVCQLHLNKAGGKNKIGFSEVWIPKQEEVVENG